MAGTYTTLEKRTVSLSLLTRAERRFLGELTRRFKENVSFAGASEASVRLHENLGFKKIGVMSEVGRKFGRLIDVHLYQYLFESNEEDRL